MNNLIFPAKKCVEMTFRVNIAGTQSSPTAVLVVLERDGRQLSYSATKNTDDWIANIENPGSVFQAGDVKFCINVLINGRLFTPVRSMATIIDEHQPEEIAVVSVVPTEEPIIQDLVDEVPTAPQIPQTQESIVPTIVEEKVEKPKKISKKKIVKEDVPVIEPVKVPKIKMGLLKSIELPTERIETSIPIQEAQATVPNSFFNLKKLRTVYR